MNPLSKHRSILLLTAILGALAGGGWWLQARAAPATGSSPIEATGVIEARQSALASEIGGQVNEVLVEEGQRVQATQPLIRLDDSLLQKQREQAQSELDASQAKLRMLEEGATQDQLDAAEAQLAQAEANLQLAQSALDIASEGTRPEDIAASRVQLDEARARYYSMTISLTGDQFNALEATLRQANESLARATRRREELENNHSIPAYAITFAEAAVRDSQSVLEATQGALDAAQDEVIPYFRQIELARAALKLAESNESQAQARLEGLQSDSKVPNEAIDHAESTLDEARALVDAAKSAYDELTSGASNKRLDSAWNEVQQAQRQLASIVRASGSAAEVLLAQVDAASSQHAVAAANLSALRNGARQEEIEAARAQVEAARAQRDALDIQLKKLTITAPWDGVVLTRNAEVGEIALPGATLIDIGRLDDLELRVYLPEETFGLIVPGQAAQVRVDAYPERVFGGLVLRMSDEAEFTPTNVQTKEDRTRLVYSVVVRLVNTDLALKPGMIAEAEFAN